MSSTSNKVEGLVENIVDTSNGVQRAVEHIAEGAYSQTEDANDCMEIVAGFSERMNLMEQMTQELVAMASEMAAENKQSKEAVQSLIENQKKNQTVIDTITEEIHAGY